ncbi:MAG: hypothetical protein HQK55_08095 [Deltaproteobacteria bacterium]|nr:hypothetical protein [Deltaproteobacteria bacterium]
MKNIAGFFLIFLSLFMLMGFFKADLDMSPAVKLTALAIASGLPLLGGIWLFYTNYREKARLAASKLNLAAKTREAEVLKLAEKLGGRLTAVEVVTALALDQAQAKDLLESLASQGLAEVGLTDTGVIVYSFYDVLHLKEKNKAKNVLEV